MYFARKFKIPRIESEKHVFELGQKKSYQISGEACTELPGERDVKNLSVSRNLAFAQLMYRFLMRSRPGIT